MDVEIVVPLGICATVAAVILVPLYFRRLEREKLFETLKAAYDKGQPVPPELIDTLTRPEKVRPALPTAERDLRRGVIALAWALAFVICGLLSQDFEYGPDLSSGWFGVAAFPGMIGVAYLAFGLLNRNRRPAQS